LSLSDRREIVGEDNEAGVAAINVEGLTFRFQGARLIASFFHRGNANLNGHDSVVEFDALTWLSFLKTGSDTDLVSADYWKRLVPLRVVRFAMPRVESADGSRKTFPISLNDAIEARAGKGRIALLPVSTEAEYVDAAGNQEDGVVTFSGLVRWDDDGARSRCRIFQAPGDDAPGVPSRFGKVEGLTAWRTGFGPAFEKGIVTNKSVLVGVTDTDSEVVPSRLSVLDVTGVLD